MTGRRGFVIRIAVSLGLLAALFKFGGVAPADVAARIRDAPPAPLLAAAGVYCVLGTVLRGWRWRALIRDLGHQITLWRCTEIFLIGTTFNQVLPTGIGGDVVRSVMLGRDGLGPARAASTVLVERAEGMVALLAVGVVMLSVAGTGMPPGIRLLMVVAAIGGVGGAVVLRRGEAFRSRSAHLPLIGKLARHPGVVRFTESFGEYSLRAVSWAFALSVAFAGLLVVANRLLGMALGAENVGWPVWGLVVPLIALSLMVPSIAGLGVREWTYVGLLGALADPPIGRDTAIAVSLAFHGLNLLLAFAGGVLMAAGAVRDAARTGSPPADR